MGDQLPAEEDLGRLPTDTELARLQRTTVSRPSRDQPGQWVGP